MGDLVTVYWSVKNDGTDENAFEVFNRDNGKFQYSTPESSTTSPSNCTNPNVISVAAINRSNYISGQGTTGINAAYSSQGPSNSNMTLPDISGPTLTTTLSAGTFSGTSCSTPNAAGMTAAFWSRNPTLSANGVRKVLFKLADMYGDFGPNGKDNIYGVGGFFLHDYVPNTRYILSTAGNSTGSNQLPYNTIQQMNTHSGSGWNAMFLGEVFDSPPTGTAIDKPMIYRSIKSNTIIN